MKQEQVSRYKNSNFIVRLKHFSFWPLSGDPGEWIYKGCIMYRLKSSGPRIEPCGTPDKMLVY